MSPPQKRRAKGGHEACRPLEKRLAGEKGGRGGGGGGGGQTGTGRLGGRGTHTHTHIAQSRMNARPAWGVFAGSRCHRAGAGLYGVEPPEVRAAYAEGRIAQARLGIDRAGTGFRRGTQVAAHPQHRELHGPFDLQGRHEGLLRPQHHHHVLGQAVHVGSMDLLEVVVVNIIHPLADLCTRRWRQGCSSAAGGDAHNLLRIDPSTDNSAGMPPEDNIAGVA